MSFLTGTSEEVIYSSLAVGATLATFTTEALLNTTATMGVQPHLPPDFFLPNNTQPGRGIRVTARGVLSTTSSAPTFTINVRGGAAGNVSSTPILLGSGAITAGISQTNQYWELKAEVVLTAIAAAGANSTVRGNGYLICGGLASPFIYPVWGGGSSPGTTATLDTSVTNYINVTAACSASNAANSITLNQLIVEGLN
jgi:hypothetical protein